MTQQERLTAAGGVLWRPTSSGPDVLLVHRPGYDDWSLPKGKPDKGENSIQTAVREVEEETGLSFAVGPRLGSVRYPVKGRSKTVWYWSMRLDPQCTDDPRSIDDDEVDEFAWLPLAKAFEALTYPADRQILSRFAKVGTIPVSLILVRHGRAGSRSRWDGPDDLRPLDGKGTDQAEMVGRTVPSLAPTRLLSAPPARCLQTAEPLASRTGMMIETSALISDHCWESDPEAAIDRLHRLAIKGERVVAVSQGKVMEAALNSMLPKRSASYATKKGGMWVIGASDHRIVTYDYYPSLLPT